MKKKQAVGVLLFLVIAVSAIAGQDDGVKIPDAVKPFVEKGKTALALETADLNGDGFADFVLVVENTGAANREGSDDIRSLLILIADRTGKLKLAKRNDKVVYCRSCGGVFGDPFAGLTVKRNSFTVDNYGGSNWRWSDSYTFNYSRIDQTWQLVKVTKETFNATNPKEFKTKVRTPKNFGKVDIADADPDKVSKF